MKPFPDSESSLFLTPPSGSIFARPVLIQACGRSSTPLKNKENMAEGPCQPADIVLARLAHSCSPVPQRPSQRSAIYYAPVRLLHSTKQILGSTPYKKPRKCGSVLSWLKHERFLREESLQACRPVPVWFSR